MALDSLCRTLETLITTMYEIHTEPEPRPANPKQIIKRILDGAQIPFAEDNTDYQEYLAWLAEGNEPLPADPAE